MITKDVSARHKTQLRDYFDGIGFERWSAIYGNDMPLSFIRRTVREGHEIMIELAKSWLLEVCPTGSLFDAGCGTGIFSIAMAQAGLDVTAVDISPRMIARTNDDAATAGVGDHIRSRAADIASVDGTFDAVSCFDVLVHYPEDLFVPLFAKLAQQSDKTLIFTYAPYNRFLALLHWVGGFFPSGQRRTEIQMIHDATVSTTLNLAGLHIQRRATISHGFYHVCLLQAVRS